MTQPTTVFLGLGANVGDRLETLATAVYALDDVDRLTVEDVSGVYETAPWGDVDQDPYLNLVVRAACWRSPRALLDECQLIETVLGRDRPREVRWGPRPVDIDLLLYGDATVDEPGLRIPHARLAERAFVLVPLLEVLPGGELPDGRRLTRVLADLAPVEGVDLFVRLDDVPRGGHLTRPEGPVGPRPFLAGEHERPLRPGPEVER